MCGFDVHRLEILSCSLSDFCVSFAVELGSRHGHEVMKHGTIR